MQAKIEENLKYIPVISLFILISSLIKNYIYYDYFGININEFASLSEFTLLFVSEIKLYLTFILSLIIFLPFIFLKNYTQTKFGEKNFSYTLTKSFTTFFILLFPIRIIMTIINENDIVTIIEKCQNWLILLFISILLLIKKDTKFIRNLYLFFCVLSLLIFSITKPYIDIEKVKRNIPNYNVEFVFENINYKTKKDYIFIGKTHEFLFIHNLKNNYTEVFKIQEIKKFKIKKMY